MRGTFALVVAAGVAASVVWSLVRHAGEEEGPDAQGTPNVQRDPSPDRTPSGPDVRAAADARARPEEGKPLSALPDDAVAAAKALLAADARRLRDDATRRSAIAVASKLAAGADAMPTRDGVEARVLARRLFASVYDCDASTPEERDVAYQRSRELFEVLVRGNGAPPELALRHRVEPGQSVWALARGPWRQAGATVAPGFVLWVNGVPDARRLRAGQVLKVPLEPLSVVVRKRAFELTVNLGDAPVERFRVAVGADAKTPVGVFQVKDCLKNPDWYMNGKRIPFGAPGHIIGTRWIGFSGGPEADGIGIHGTNDEASIGTAASLGCVRMRNADVERIFEWVVPGTRVEIRD